jgi:Flp pilus assembly protein TadG
LVLPPTGDKFIPKKATERSNMRRHMNFTRRISRGQAIAEFALILPLLIGLVGAGIDFARAFEGSMTLQTAARNAAEAAAFDPVVTDEAGARAKARAIVCTEARRLPGFTPGSGGDVKTCTNPNVSVTFLSSISAPGANSRYPLVTVTVTTSMDFAMTVPWPFLPDGTWSLGSTEKFQILQGR